MAKARFDIVSEATRPLYAGVGATERAVEAVREYVADVQKRFVDVQKSVTETVTRTVGELDLQPQALREQALTTVTAGVEALSKDARERRAAIEARVSELQAEAQAKVLGVIGVLGDREALGSVYADLARRGEVVVNRIRQSEPASPKAGSKASAKPAAAKAAGATSATKTAKPAARTSAAKTTTKAAKPAARKTPVQG